MNELSCIIDKGILDRITDIPAQFLRDRTLLDLLSEFCHSVLTSYNRYRDQLEAKQGNIARSIECFVNTLLRLDNSFRQNQSVTLVKVLLESYVQWPALFDSWLVARKEDEFVRRGSHALIRRTPSMMFTVRLYTNISFIKTPDVKLTQESEKMLALLMEICRHSEALEREIISSDFIDTLLCIPKRMLRDSHHTPKYAVNQNTQRVEFNEITSEHQLETYSRCLVVYLSKVDKFGTKRIQKHMFHKLFEFFREVIDAYNTNEDPKISKLLFVGLQTACDHDAHQPLILKHMQKMIDDDNFRNLMWSCLLCFKETEVTSTFTGTALRSTHTQAINFLWYALTSGNDIMETIAYSESSTLKYDVQWSVDILYDNREHLPLDRLYKDLTETLLNYEQPLNAANLKDSLFSELLLARTNTIALFSPTENELFFEILLKVLRKTRCSLVANATENLSKALIRLNPLSGDCKIADVSYPVEFKTLRHRARLQHWLFFWSQNPHKSARVAKNMQANIKAYAVLIGQIYRYCKFFTLVDTMQI